MDNTLTWNGQVFQTGDWVTCCIEGEHIKTARIFIISHSTGYICQNTFDGSMSPDRLGFNFSWGYSCDETVMKSVSNLKLADAKYTPMAEISEYRVNLLIDDGFVSTCKPEKTRR